jgi:hypothetical protein
MKQVCCQRLCVAFDTETYAPKQMEALSEISQATLDALVRNYVVIIAITVLVLGLTLYIYFFPTPFTEYFKNPEKEAAADKKLPATGRV